MYAYCLEVVVPKDAPSPCRRGLRAFCHCNTCAVLEEHSREEKQRDRAVAVAEHCAALVIGDVGARDSARAFLLRHCGVRFKRVQVNDLDAALRPNDYGARVGGGV